jgi:hypothetical protein
LTAICASCSSVVPWSAMRRRHMKAQNAGPGTPTQSWRRYSGSVVSSTPEVWMNPFGIFSPPTTSTTSCMPLATSM